MQIRIRKLLLIIFLSLSTIPILLSHIFSFLEEKTLLQSNIVGKLNDVATLQHKRIQQLLSHNKESVNLIANQAQLKLLILQYTENKTVENLNSIVNVLHEARISSVHIRRLSIFSTQQQFIASTASEEQSKQGPFNNKKLEKDAFLIQFIRDKNNLLLIHFIKKLYKDDKHIANLSATFSSTELTRIISDYTGLGQTGEIILAAKNKEGNTQFLTPSRHNKNPAITITIPKEKLEIPSNYTLNNESIMLPDYIDYRSIPVLAIYRHIPKVDWGMITKIDQQEAFEPLDNLQDMLTKIVLLIIVFGILLSLFIGNKLAKPILALEQVVQGIMKGDTNLRARKSKLTEINQLGNAFNQMVSAQLSADALLHDSIKKLTDINAQINSESARFKRWKESNFIGILHSDAHGNIIDANTTLLGMIGYSEADLLNGNIDWLKLTPEEFLPLDLAAIAEAEEKGFWTPFEKEYVHKNGHRVPILIGGSIFKYDSQEFIVFIIDLTERNQQLDALGKYKRIFENSNDLIAYVDKNYQFKMVNYTYSKYHGLSKDNIENHSLNEVLGKEVFHDKIKDSIDKALLGSVIKFSEIFNFKEAGKRLLNVTYTPYKNDDGDVVGFIFRGEDITELDEQRQLTQLTKIEQEQIINSMLEGVLTADDKGKILTFNPEAENIFGYHHDEIIGKNVSLLIPSTHALMHDNYLLDFSKGKKSNMVGNRQGRNVTALHKDNSEFPLRISIAELPKNELNRVNYIANFQDLTEAERQKEMVNRSLRMESLGTVTGGIAHDFNNILGIITGYCSLLLDKPTSEKSHRYLSAIEAASNRGAKLTKNLLTFSKNQSTAISLVSINDVILTNKEMLKTLLTSKISLQLALDKSLLSTCIDKNLLEDLLLNMSINAMHAMPDGGILQISTENAILSLENKFDMPFKAGQFVKITIEDNGFGMNKEVCSQIFEPFYTTKGNIGNGLGLSQCYGFVTSSKGVIAVDSSPNKGTVFSIYFPASMKDTSIKHLLTITEVDNKQLETKNYTVIIVDDESQILKLNTEVLKSTGFTVFNFNNAEDALALLTKQHVDIVVTDVVMPKMGGVEFINKAKKIAPAIKYLFVSGYLGEQENEIKQNITPLLSKPYTREELITAVKTQCRMSISIE